MRRNHDREGNIGDARGKNKTKDGGYDICIIIDKDFEV
jgi:hypothetical protein